MSRKHTLPLVLAGVLCSALSYGMWSSPTGVPVGRLVVNVTKYTQEHPDDAEGFYVLGRVHSLAFTLRSRAIGAWEKQEGEPRQGLPSVEAIWPPRFRRGIPWRSQPSPTREELIRHLEPAIRSFQKATQLDSKPGRYYLSLAVILECGAPYADKANILPDSLVAAAAASQDTGIEKLIAALGDPAPDVRARSADALRVQLDRAAPLLYRHRQDAKPEAREAVRELLATYWSERAITYYYVAFERAIDDDLARARDDGIFRFSDLVSHEAGNAYVHLVKGRGIRDEAEKTRVAKVEANLSTIQKTAKFYVTPIVFSLERSQSLCELLADEREVWFDLDGDGKVERWPWVKPTTGILVWDPTGEGKIISGRQLFGSVTWWMLFRDGYQALDALDDDRDGYLTGSELAGLAVWFDRNGNGVSDPGEVVPIAALGIQSICTRSTSNADGCPANPFGLRLADGRLLPTYDWIASPAAERSTP